MHARRLAVLTVTTVAVLGGAASVAGFAPNRAVRAEARAAYDGETVFRGVFFGEGPVAARLPEMWKERRLGTYSGAVGAAHATAAVEDEIVAEMRLRDPAFFDRFGAALQSGRHVAVDQAMREAADMVAKSRAVQEVDPATGSGTCIVVAVYKYVVVVSSAIVVKSVAIVLDASATDPSELRRDQIVHLLATRLKH
ncbi:MAG: hypothetical protein JWM27_4109 [Gemmatimonadetes bacterium]|nr:hypothetical protein [Gemmatimonadota bacterium]